MVKFLFSVHTITEAKQSNRQGGSQGGGYSSNVIWPGAPWCNAATVRRSE